MLLRGSFRALRMVGAEMSCCVVSEVPAGPMAGQQALTAPEPAEGVSAPDDGPGRWFHWGVDPGVSRTSIAWTDGEERGVVSIVPRGIGPARLYDLYAAVKAQARDLATGSVDGSILGAGVPPVLYAPPAVVVVEQVSVYMKRVNPVVYEASGVVLAALYGALRTLWAHPVAVVEFTSAEWKKAAVGAGHAKKEDVMVCARELGYDGAVQDEADAWTIAEAARRRVDIRGRA